MGLDLVEFTMAVEEAFQISIPESDAQGITTPRELIDYLHAQLSGAPEVHCISQRTFHRLRRAAMEQLGIERRLVRPNTMWASLLPRTTRREVWRRLHRATGTKAWPTLHRSAAVVGGIAGFSVVVGAAAIWAIEPDPLNVTAAIISLVASATLLTLATEAWRLDFPRKAASVGGTAEFLATFAPAEIKGSDAQWTREQIREVVHRLLHDMFGLTEFTDDSSFIDDMGLD